MSNLPYEAVSINGRAMEWKKPLWDAIHRYERSANDHAREAAVVEAEHAVEQAMRLALECREIDVRATVTRDQLVRIWRAVLSDAVSDGYEFHIVCEKDPPEECALYKVIADAAVEAKP